MHLAFPLLSTKPILTPNEFMMIYFLGFGINIFLSSEKSSFKQTSCFKQFEQQYNLSSGFDTKWPKDL